MKTLYDQICKAKTDKKIFDVRDGPECQKDVETY